MNLRISLTAALGLAVLVCAELATAAYVASDHLTFFVNGAPSSKTYLILNSPGEALHVDVCRQGRCKHQQTREPLRICESKQASPPDRPQWDRQRLDADPACVDFDAQTARLVAVRKKHQATFQEEYVVPKSKLKDPAARARFAEDWERKLYEEACYNKHCLDVKSEAAKAYFPYLASLCKAPLEIPLPPLTDQEMHHNRLGTDRCVRVDFDRKTSAICPPGTP